MMDHSSGSLTSFRREKFFSKALPADGDGVKQELLLRGALLALVAPMPWQSRAGNLGPSVAGLGGTQRRISVSALGSDCSRREGGSPSLPTQKPGA